jgi:hypothetical protein
MKHQLIEEYENIRKKGLDHVLGEHIIKMIKTPEYTGAIKYIATKLDSVFGLHTVYVAYVKTESGEKAIKIGYSKNTVGARFSEERWQDPLKLVGIIHAELFPSLGAIKFENRLKNRLTEYRLIDKKNKTKKTKAPGKGELFQPKYKEKILEEYELWKNQYTEVRGVKPPN